MVIAQYAITMKYFSLHTTASICIGLIFLYVAINSCTNRGSSTSVYTQDAAADTTRAAGTGLVNTTRGKELFQQKCMACHGVNGDARNNNAADLSMTRLDSLGIATTVLNGRNTMPPFKDAISNEDLSSIIVYVRTLRGNGP